MLEIVLLILKIAGIILAAVLGILIVALWCVLFVPVRYRGDFSVADAENGEKKRLCAKLRAVWLLRFVGVYVSFEETLRVRVKVFVFTLMDTAKEKEDRGKKEKSRKDKKEKEKAAGEDKTKEPKGESEGSIPKEESDKTKGEDAESKETVSRAVKEEVKSGETADKAAGDTGSKEPSSKEKRGIRKRISNILQTIRDFCDKLKGIKEKTGKIKELWISGHMVSARSLLGRQFVYLLKHTKPKKLEGYLRFGFDDPSATGYAMAAYGILYPLWSPKLSVEPDFEKQILDCHIRIKGKIRAWHFLRAVLRLILSKDVRRAIRDVKEL